MDPIDRRTAIRLAATAPLAASFSWTACEVGDASRQARSALASGEPFEPQFFDEHEWRTVRILADMVIPADDRSGSATDAGVPEFMDFMMIDRPNGQDAMRDGLRWLDAECTARFQSMFTDCTDEQRRAVLDDIAWPDRAQPEHADGVTFFNMFRDLTASGFWSSRIGVEDLGYIGNTVVPEWNGCPPEALRKLGVSYDT